MKSRSKNRWWREERNPRGHRAAEFVIPTPDRGPEASDDPLEEGLDTPGSGPDGPPGRARGRGLGGSIPNRPEERPGRNAA